MDNLSFLFAAYSVTWVVLFFYIYSLWRKQDRVEEGLRKLKNKVEGAENPKHKTRTGE